MTLLVLLLAMAAPLAPDTTRAAAPPEDPSRQVITRDEIDASGAYRITDLLRLIESARYSTIEGLSWRLSLVDGDPFGAETVTLLVDGVELELDVLGQRNLALLPAAISQIDSVEVWAGPRLAAGRFTSGGVIHIHTQQRRQPGLATRTGVAIGLQNGDPGPFRYVPELSSLNVDKFGADYEGWAGAAGSGWRSSARFSLVRFYPTHATIHRRNVEILNGQEIPRSRLLTGALRFDVDALMGQHTAQVLGGYFSDLWFFAPFGRELSTLRRYGQAAVTGSVPVGVSGAQVTYRLSATENLLEKRFEEALGPDPGWRGTTLVGGGDVRLPVGEVVLVTGGSVQRRALRGADGFTVARLHGGLERQREMGAGAVVAALAAAEGQLAASIRVTSSQNIGRVAVAASGALAQRLPAEDARLAFWQDRGYHAFEREIDVIGAPAGRSRLTHGELTAALPLDGRTHLNAGLGLRRFSGLAIETQPVASDPDQLAADRLTVMENGASGSVLHGHSRLSTRQGIWRGGLSLDVQAPLAGHSAFEQAWKAVPRLRASARTSVLPAPSFTASTRLALQSGSYWAGHDHLTGGNGGRYDASLPSAWLLDVSLDKWFVQQTLRAHLSFMNILNQDERHHPVGAPLGRRMYLRVELKLD